MTRLGVPPPRSPAWIAMGAVLSGITTYAMLVVVGRVLGAGAYGEFSVFWSAILIASFGLFLPIEQVVARRQAGRDTSAPMLCAATRAGLLLAAVAIVVLIAASELGPTSSTISGVAAVAFSVAALGFAAQFPARGVLAGTLRMRGYAAVITIDAVLRFVVVVVLAVCGVATVGPYATTIAATALGSGIVGLWLSRPRAGAPTPAVDGIVRETAGLSVAMLCMQLLVNSPMLIAGFICDDPVVAGHLLALTTVARLSVFVAQSGQAVYVGRIAAATFRGDDDVRRRLIRWVAGGIGAVAMATLAGMALVGPPLIDLVYGDGYAVDRLECVLVGAGVAAYLIASVANDLSVALEQHRRAGAVWLLGAAAAMVPVVQVDDPIWRSTLPLLVGSTVAAALTLRKLISSRSPRMVL